MTTTESPKIEVTAFNDDEDDLDKELNTFIEENENQNDNKKKEEEVRELCLFCYSYFIFLVYEVSKRSNISICLSVCCLSLSQHACINR